MTIFIKNLFFYRCNALQYIDGFLGLPIVSICHGKCVFKRKSAVILFIPNLFFTVTMCSSILMAFWIYPFERYVIATVCSDASRLGSFSSKISFCTVTTRSKSLMASFTRFSAVYAFASSRSDARRAGSVSDLVAVRQEAVCSKHRAPSLKRQSLNKHPPTK